VNLRAFPKTATASINVSDACSHGLAKRVSPKILSIQTTKIPTINNATTTMLTTDENTMPQIQEQANHLRQELKEWEKSFAAANQGRKAERDDIKAHPTIGTAPEIFSPSVNTTAAAQLTHTIPRGLQHSNTKPTPSSATSFPVTRLPPITPPLHTRTHTLNHNSNTHTSRHESVNTPSNPPPTHHTPT